MTRENHLILTDSEFERQFKACLIKPECFSHEAHLRLAYIQIRKYGIEAALMNVQNQLYNYVNAIGAGDKYNKTVTIAAVRAVHHFMMKCKTNSFIEFVEAFPQLKYNFKYLMFCHYKTDIFKSKRAKISFIEPELLPFD